jgi:hypothetical protein
VRITVWLLFGIIEIYTCGLSRWFLIFLFANKAGRSSCTANIDNEEPVSTVNCCTAFGFRYRSSSHRKALPQAMLYGDADSPPILIGILFERSVDVCFSLRYRRSKKLPDASLDASEDFFSRWLDDQVRGASCMQVAQERT